MAASLPPFIDLSSSNDNEDLFGNDVQPIGSFGKSSSPAIALPFVLKLSSLPAPLPRRPFRLPDLVTSCVTSRTYKKPPLAPISKFRASKAPVAQYYELSSSDEDLPKGANTFVPHHSNAAGPSARVREQDVYALGAPSGSGSKRGGGLPPAKRIKVTTEVSLRFPPSFLRLFSLSSCPKLTAAVSMRSSLSPNLAKRPSPYRSSTPS